jgi:hypothetical protein
MKAGGLTGAAVVVALVLALVLSACGGGGGADGSDDVAALGDTSDEATGDGGSAAEDRREGALAFARCMRKNGIDHPDPDESGMFRIEPNQGFDPQSAEFREAADTCEKHLGELGPPPEPSPEDRKEMEEQLLALARCMREHGIDMPDPEFGGEGGGFALTLPEGLDPDDPDFRAAQEACRKYSPEANPSGEGR